MQEVSVLASDCASMLLDSVVSVVPDGCYQLLSQLVSEATFPANLAALQMLNARLNDDAEVSDARLAMLVSCLLKVYSYSSECPPVCPKTHSITAMAPFDACPMPLSAIRRQSFNQYYFTLLANLVCRT